MKTVTSGATAALAFAVSPDGRQIVISTITEAADANASTGHEYVEDLTDSAGHLDILTNTGRSAFRWPVAWFGTDIVNGVSSGYCGDPHSIPVYAPVGCTSSYHVINAGTGARIATMCEQPADPAGASYTWAPLGPVTPAGVVCAMLRQEVSGGETCSTAAVDLSGTHHTFLTGCDGQGQWPCALASDGSRMACQVVGDNTLEFASGNGAVHDLGLRYTPIGWMDATHLMVDVDASTLAVLDADTGSVAELALPNADKVEMDGVIPS